MLAADRPPEAKCLSEPLHLGWMHEEWSDPALMRRERRRMELRALLVEHGGDPETVAQALEVSRSTVYRQCADLGVPRPPPVQRPRQR